MKTEGGVLFQLRGGLFGETVLFFHVEYAIQFALAQEFRSLVFVGLVM